MLNAIKKVLFTGLAMSLMFCPMTQKALPKDLQTSVTVQATTKKQALKAYKKFLSKKTLKFYGRNGKTVKLKKKNTKFDIAYINKGKYPYLIIMAADNIGINHSTKYVNFFGAKGNKIKFIVAYDTISYIKNKGAIGLPVPRSEATEYYKIKGNKLKGQISRPSGKEIFPKGHIVNKKNIKKFVK